LRVKKPMAVLVADDHEAVRERVRGLLEASKDIRVVAEAGDGREALRLAQELGPDVVVLDISMPALNGMEVLSELQERCPELPVVLLTMYVHPDLIRRAFNEGAAAYVVKKNMASELERAVRAAHAGQRFFSVDHEVCVPQPEDELFGAPGLVF
jgi:DNA-binding NarL/FixJ family response regulator